MNKNGKSIFTCKGELLKGVGDRIRLVRKNEKQLSQGQLADIVGLSMNTINRYERNHRSPTIEEITRIGEALDCDPCWLLTGRSCSESALGEVGVPILENSSTYGVANRIAVPGVDSGDYALRMDGDEMSPRIHNGDWLLVREVETQSGDVALIEDNWGGQRVRWQREVGGKSMFVAENPAYDAIEECSAKVLGKVVSSVRVIKL